LEELGGISIRGGDGIYFKRPEKLSRDIRLKGWAEECEEKCADGKYVLLRDSFFNIFVMAMEFALLSK
jgi:hypothetical protein